MKLFKFQQECRDQLIKGFSKNRIQALSWHTGAGKTNVFCSMIEELIKKDPSIKVGISSYLTTEIRDQIFERLESFGLKDFSQVLLGPVSPDKTKNIFVFNPQAIYKKKPSIEFDYLIIDESHAGIDEGTKMIRAVMKKWSSKKTKILLVSATPWDTLAMKEFKDAPNFKRPLDQGFEDGLITDFKFHCEEAQITFSEDDFGRAGDLIMPKDSGNLAILKSACRGKLEYIVKKFDKELGKKVLVICPPGNYSEIARELAVAFGGLPFVQTFSGHSARSRKNELVGIEETVMNLDLFKNSTTRFLFVTKKCQVGFDMEELTSVVDLTMSRNIKVLAQRLGRVARKSGAKQKHYFYVYDKSLMKDRLEWLLSTIIDFSLGSYDGWTTKTGKWREANGLGGNQRSFKKSIFLSEIVRSLRSPKNIHDKQTIKYVSKARPTNRTLEQAIEQATAFESRTDMWAKAPALYKWFRLNDKEEMDRIFPLKMRHGKWNEKTVIAAMKKCKSRVEFDKTHGGAQGWILTHKRIDLRDKYLPPSTSSRRWDEEAITKLLSRIRTWGHLRANYSGARRWMHAHRGEKHWQKIWENMHQKTYSPRSASA